MNLKSDYLKTVALNYLATIIQILTSLILIPLILNKSGISAVGTYTLLFSLKSLCDLGVGWLSNASIQKFLMNSNEKDKVDEIFYSADGFYKFYGILVFFLFNGYAAIFTPKDFSSFFGYSVFSAFTFFPKAGLDFLVATRRQALNSAFNLVQNLLTLIVSILILVIKNDIVFVFWGMAFVSFVCFLSFSIFSKIVLSYDFKFSFSYLSLKNLLKGTHSYFWFSFSLILVLQIDTILLSHLRGSEALGLFSLIWRIPNTLIQLGWRVFDPLSAEIGYRLESSFEAGKTYFLKSEKHAFLLASIFALGYFLMGELVYKVWLGATTVPIEFSQSKIVMSGLIFFLITQKYYASVSVFTKNISSISICYIIEILIKIIFSLFLFNYFGITTSLWGWFACLCLLTFWISRKAARSVFTKVPEFH